MNIDAKENEVIISIKKETTPIVVNIMAVDRCGTKSARSSKVVPFLRMGSGLENSPSTSTASYTCAVEVISSIVVTLLVALMVVVISVLITWKISVRRQSSGRFPVVTHDDEAKLVNMQIL